MAFTPSENSGAAFKNDRMREGRKDPRYTGQVVIDSVPYWIDIWVKNDPKEEDYNPQKKTFLSLSFRPKDKPAASKTPPVRRAAPPRPPSDEPNPTDLHDKDRDF